MSRRAFGEVVSGWPIESSVSSSSWQAVSSRAAAASDAGGARLIDDVEIVAQGRRGDGAEVLIEDVNKRAEERERVERVHCAHVGTRTLAAEVARTVAAHRAQEAHSARLDMTARAGSARAVGGDVEDGIDVLLAGRLRERVVEGVDVEERVSGREDAEARLDDRSTGAASSAPIPATSAAAWGTCPVLSRMITPSRAAVASAMTFGAEPDSVLG
jgi:hypothetical protein